MPRNNWLIVGGWLSGAASLLHVLTIVGGPVWYKFFGAGEEMAQAAARGDAYPALVTFAIAAVLALWAAYAFAGAGRLPRLPLMRTALTVIAAIYLVRGLALVPALLVPALSTPFNIWSSLIVLVFGIVYAIGTWRAWPSLSPKGLAA